MAQTVNRLPTMRETRVQPLGREDPLEKEMAPHSSTLPGKSLGRRSLVGYISWGHKESDMTEPLSLILLGLPWWLRGYSVCLQCGRPGFNPWVGKILWRRKWQPTRVLLPGKSHEWRSVVHYSPWGCKVSDTTERLHFLFICKLSLVRGYDEESNYHNSNKFLRAI